jgi:hypothetical protein
MGSPGGLRCNSSLVSAATPAAQAFQPPLAGTQASYGEARRSAAGAKAAGLPVRIQYAALVS